ncbi:phenylalanine--tRNA ligase, chloroplastic/mitochondrial-like [Vitis vinifera]|uniref:phenylalanine--tRNA ligase, chloroplastic/mitochondrial-like n=1 Tax=Vitis vinifera TaxID=29760 RepID=UPI0028834F2B|nr:phenylalanine--tRNA ligase, chloroplastic/mitochondrial-like [Vitis vinifera]
MLDFEENQVIWKCAGLIHISLSPTHNLNLRYVFRSVAHNVTKKKTTADLMKALSVFWQNCYDLTKQHPLIIYQENWLEVLGCGVTEQEILKKSGKTGNVALAFGLGLERLAMVLFGIPDIWLFWSTDERFTSQFSKGQLGVKFKPFSKYPPCYKDKSFWINELFTENNLCDVVRGVAGDLVEGLH